MRHALLASALTLAVLTAAGVTSGPAQAEVLRLNTPAVGLTIDRIGALPDMERGAWADYLARSQAQHQADRAALAAKGVKRVEDWLPILRCTPTAEESMAINRIKSGAIIIAGAGMCNGGRIVHHFKHNLWRENCHLVFPGFQAKGTLGRLIVDGAETVKVLHQRIAVKAKVHTLGGFSAHAGQSQLIDWASQFEHHPELYLVHGELEKMQTLQQALRQRLNWIANIPEPGEQIAL